ncbi:hypothetical protein [Lelliottia sp. CFBP8978]|uniref:hypothetical protein n=1 Tax=Lelliottia sp. CFBP8978 TaxID=3096522 RepID=UPI002A6A44D3|nr:hypothetical protein [Lelliottia sp. CFBP8978]MDY1037147.1 hypothetical protein [Lelliottia sp. CFBP8978]
MKTSASVTLAILAVITVGAVYLWPYVKMDFTESASYTEQDKREYEFFTPDILKNMPRVSDHYQFGYSNVSGPDLLIYEVTFSGTTHTSRINHYLQKNGFRRLGSCDIDGECWQGDEPGMSVSVSINAKSEIIIVSVMDKS